MHKYFISICLLVLLIGCKTTGTYEQTSQELIGLELIEPHFGYHKSWAPLGSKDGYDMTEVQKVELSKDIEVCISNLKSVHANAPSHALRTIQLIDCMKEKGWHLVVEELFITTEHITRE